LAVEAGSDEFILGLATPPVPRLRGGEGNKVLVL
jgi:hypothetical protein